MAHIAAMEGAMASAMSQVPVTEDPLLLIAAAIEHIDYGRADPAGATLMVLMGEWGVDDPEDPRLDIIETAGAALESGDHKLARTEMVKLQTELEKGLGIQV